MRLFGLMINPYNLNVITSDFTILFGQIVTKVMEKRSQFSGHFDVSFPIHFMVSLPTNRILTCNDISWFFKCKQFWAPSSSSSLPFFSRSSFKLHTNWILANWFVTEHTKTAVPWLLYKIFHQLWGWLTDIRWWLGVARAHSRLSFTLELGTL